MICIKIPFILLNFWMLLISILLWYGSGTSARIPISWRSLRRWYYKTRATWSMIQGLFDSKVMHWIWAQETSPPSYKTVGLYKSVTVPFNHNKRSWLKERLAFFKAFELDTAEIFIFIGQRSSPRPCNMVEMDIKFHLECMLRSCAQRMLRKMHSTDVSISIEAKYLISWLSLDVNEREDQLWNSSFCTKTADWKSRWPHGNQDVLELTPANVPPGLLWHCQAPGPGAWGLCTVQRLSDHRRCRWRFLRTGSARCGTLSQLCRKWTPLVRSCSRTLCVVYIRLWTGWCRLEDEESVQRRTTSMTLTSDSQNWQIVRKLSEGVLVNMTV